MNRLKGAKDIYTNEYYVGGQIGTVVSNSVLLKYKYPYMFAEQVGITVVFEDDNSITVIDWFKDDITKDISNKLVTYFELLGCKAIIR